MTNASATITHASVVSRETVKIVLMINALNDLEKFTSILNAYVHAPVTEKMLATFSPKFGKDARE